MNYRDRLYRQLALDYSTTPEAFRGGKNLFPVNRQDPRRRVYLNKGSELLRVLMLGDIAVFRCGSDEIAAALQAQFSDAPAEWMLSIRSLEALQTALHPFGARIVHHQLYFLPTGHFPAPRPDLSLRWYEAEALEQFRGDERFGHALGFIPDMPDMLAVACEENGVILGMAGASRDAEDFWQIGINVIPSARRRGIASALTAALAQELLARDVLPFYGTAPSHIFSQRTALSAGFLPAWAELRTEPIKKEEA